MSQRGRAFGEFDRQYYEAAITVYRVQNPIESAEHLGNLILSAAEGKESQKQLKEDHKLQIIASVLTF